MLTFQFLAQEKEFIFSPAKTHELPWVDRAERNPQEREPRAAGQTRGTTRSWITAEAQAFLPPLTSVHGGAVGVHSGISWALDEWRASGRGRVLWD